MRGVACKGMGVTGLECFVRGEGQVNGTIRGLDNKRAIRELEAGQGCQSPATLLSVM